MVVEILRREQNVSAKCSQRKRRVDRPKIARATCSTDVHTDNYIFDDSDTLELFDSEAMLDDVIVSATHTSAPKCITVLDLFKVWRIDLVNSQRALDGTTHLQRRKIILL